MARKDEIINWKMREDIDPLKLKRISMMIEPILQNYAHHCIMTRALKYNRKPEYFSHYIRRLIKEDYLKMKPLLDELLKDKTRINLLREKMKFIEGDSNENEVEYGQD